MKKRRDKKYRPRPVSNGGGLTVIARCHARGQDAAPLTGDQLQDLGLAYWLSLEQLRTGDATEEAWSCVVAALTPGVAALVMHVPRPVLGAALLLSACFILTNAMQAIADEGRGVVVLIRDLSHAIADPGDVGPHTLRQYGLGAQILSALGLSDLILLTNSAPVKVVGLDAYGLSIHSTRPIPKD